MFIKNKEILNKSAVFRLKLSFPNVSDLALHQWKYQFVETVARLVPFKLQFIAKKKIAGNERMYILYTLITKYIVHCSRM